jgi:S-adenosylmethionine:diacylglycerol 3-amino-3-carboxypropyl transferase
MIDRHVADHHISITFDEWTQVAPRSRQRIGGVGFDRYYRLLGRFARGGTDDACQSIGNADPVRHT